MKTTILLATVAALAFILPGHAQATSAKGEWPRLKEESDDMRCTQVLELAKTMFRSSSTEIYAPLETPENFSSVFALQPAAIDLSQGDALTSDPKVMQKISKKTSPGNLYWQTYTQQRNRVVVEEAPASGGDTYGVHYLPEITTVDNMTGAPELSLGTKPPIILQDKKFGWLSIITLGSTDHVLDSWEVYSPGESSLLPICHVDFIPPGQTLPQSVLQLRTALLPLLEGGKKDPASQRATAAMKIRIDKVWENIAFRPWAYSVAGYEERRITDDKFARLARIRRSVLPVYQKAYGLYPQAENDLAKYYQDVMKYSPGEARSLALRNIDLAYRTHLLFLDKIK